MFQFLFNWLDRRKSQQEERDFIRGYNYAVIHLLYHRRSVDDIPCNIIHQTPFDRGIRRAVFDLHQLQNNPQEIPVKVIKHSNVTYVNFGNKCK